MIFTNLGLWMRRAKSVAIAMAITMPLTSYAQQAARPYFVDDVARDAMADSTQAKPKRYSPIQFNEALLAPVVAKDQSARLLAVGRVLASRAANRLILLRHEDLLLPPEEKKAGAFRSKLEDFMETAVMFSRRFGASLLGEDIVSVIQSKTDDESLEQYLTVIAAAKGKDSPDQAFDAISAKLAELMSGSKSEADAALCLSAADEHSFGEKIVEICQDRGILKKPSSSNTAQSSAKSQIAAPAKKSVRLVE